MKILDFGLARRAVGGPAPDETGSPTADGLTAPGVVLGTLGYLSPEQARGQDVDGRSDVFAFGSVLYEMLTGRRAFGAASASESLVAILRDEPRDPAELGIAVPTGLAGVLRRCLRKNPPERFQSASDLAFSLRAAVPEPGSASGEAAKVPVSVAVLPFRNVSPDPENEYFSDGITEELINALAQVPGPASRGQDVVVPVQGAPRGHPGDRRAPRRVDGPGRQRPQGGRPRTHLRAADQRGRRLPPVVGEPRPEHERRLRGPGGDRAGNRAAAAREAGARRRDHRQAAHERPGGVQPVSEGPVLLEPPRRQAIGPRRRRLGFKPDHSWRIGFLFLPRPDARLARATDAAAPVGGQWASSAAHLRSATRTLPIVAMFFIPHPPP